MNCKKCGAELAENQKFCPYCGETTQVNRQTETNAQPFPINTSTYNTLQPKPKKKKRWIIAIIVGVIVIAIVGNAVKNDDNKPPTKTNTTEISTQSNNLSDNTTSKTDTIPQQETHKYEDTDYIEIYNNPDNYKDKYVRIFGKISSIGKNVTGHAYITFKEGIEKGITHSIYCNISDEQKDTVLSQYTKDDYIAIEGKVGNKTVGSVNIDDCFVTLDGEEVKAKVEDFEKQRTAKIEKSTEKPTEKSTSKPTEKSTSKPTEKSTETPTPKPTEKPKNETNSISAEYRNALNSAKTYSDMMHMSKQGIYDQLISEYGDKFEKDAAQYAVDNLNANWNENALKSAKNYFETMHMSKQGIYDQLVSEYGEKFTESEAQYAVDNLQVDYNKAALETAKNYQDTMNMSKADIYDQLVSEYGEKFTESEAQYAVDNL